jgi:nitrile hydratase accessory protein
MSSAGDLLQKLDPSRGGIKPDLAVESGVPGFGQPWHAEAFGTSLALSQAGLFSWAEWVEIFSREIRTNPQRADEDSEAAYYRQWLAALEAVLEKHATLTSAEIAETAEHWRRSYLNTPHGKPIAFSREWQDQPELEGEGHGGHHRHDDGHHHPSHAGVLQPVAISPPATVSKPYERG